MNVVFLNSAVEDHATQFLGLLAATKLSPNRAKVELMQTYADLIIALCQDAESRLSQPDFEMWIVAHMLHFPLTPDYDGDRAAFLTQLKAALDEQIAICRAMLD